MADTTEVERPTDTELKTNPEKSRNCLHYRRDRE